MGWQPIETAPKDGTLVLLTAGGVVFEGRYSIDGWQTRAGYPSHWAPMPDVGEPVRLPPGVKVSVPES